MKTKLVKWKRIKQLLSYFLQGRGRVNSNENVTEKAMLKTVPSNENGTEADILLS